MANNSPHIVTDLSMAIPSSRRRCIFNGPLQVHITLAIVKFWPAFRGSIRPMCISVSFVRHFNTSSVESMTKQKMLGDTRREVLSFLCFLLREPSPHTPTEASIHCLLGILTQAPQAIAENDKPCYIHQSNANRAVCLILLDPFVTCKICHLVSNYSFIAVSNIIVILSAY